MQKVFSISKKTPMPLWLLGLPWMRKSPAPQPNDDDDDDDDDDDEILVSGPTH